MKNIFTLIVSGLATLGTAAALPGPKAVTIGSAKALRTNFNGTISKAANEEWMACNIAGWPNASCWYVRVGIDYLRRLGDHKCHGEPGVNGDPGITRVSCTYGAGIYLQNFGPNAIDIPSAWIADWAAQMVDQCGGDTCKTTNKKPGLCINGAKENDDWSVTIQGDMC